MTFEEILKTIDKDTFITVDIKMFDMHFRTNHSCEYYTNNAEELLGKSVKRIYTEMGDLCIEIMD